MYSYTLVYNELDDRDQSKTEYFPGPGVLPAVKSYGPYKTWFTGIENTSGFENLTGEDGIERV